MLSAPARRSASAALVLALGWGTLAACGGDDGSSSGASSPAAPVARPTGNPFTGSLTGPALAKAGDTITVTIDNTGRLPNQFQLEFAPVGAAVATPLSVELGAGQSAAVQVQVMTSPLNINLESASGGLGDYLDTLEVGANS